RTAARSGGPRRAGGGRGGASSPGAPPAEAAAVVSLDPQRETCTVLRRAARSPLDPADVSPPEPIAFPSAGGRVAHGILHRPRNQRYEGPAGTCPPLLVRCHGGPTSSASSALDLTVQFWTSRGFAFLDVDYAGSSAYGRDYRRLLDGSWGIADVDDCVAAERCAVAEGWVEPEARLVRGSSAGGFTALCALAFHDVFAAGASYYGIGDLEALHRETHKFESRYDEWLIGPYPERRDLYLARSPLHAAQRIASPVIFFQGHDDRIVPPGQAEAMVAALRARGLAAAYPPF